MSDILYSKLRLEVPSALNGENAIITSSKGTSRTVQMTSPITDIMLAGMEKYRVQAGFTDEDVSFGYGQIKKTEINIRTLLKKLPRGFGESTQSVVLNNRIYVFSPDRSVKKFYEFKSNYQGSSWIEHDEPFTDYYESFTGGQAVVLNNEIHILGGYYGYNASGVTQRRLDSHYKWNGTSWVSVSTLPYGFAFGKAVVLNGEIHILGSGSSDTTNYRKHYKWNGTSWVSVSTLLSTMGSNGIIAVVVFNNEIHAIGVGSSHNSHYKWNGTSWVTVSTLPFSFNTGSATVYNNEIHIIGGTSFYSNMDKHYKWNGSSWVPVSTLPYHINGWNNICVFNDNNIDNIALLGGSYNTNVAQWDGTSWTIGEDT